MISINNVINIATKNLKQIVKQKTTIALMFFAPIISFFILWEVFKDRELKIELAVSNRPSYFHTQENLGFAEYNVTDFKNNAEMQIALKKGNFNAGIDFEKENKPVIYLADTMKIINDQNILALKKALNLAKRNAKTVNAENKNQEETKKVTKKTTQKNKFKKENQNKGVKYIYNIGSFSLFDTVGPGMFAVTTMFFVFLISGISFLREKTKGTLERILISPLQLSDIIGGFGLSLGILSIFQVGIFLSFYHYILKMQWNGDIYSVSVICACIMLCSITLGMAISSLAKNEFQVVQTIPLFLTPQMALSGVFAISNPTLKSVSNFLPMTYGVKGLTDSMIKGQKALDVFLSCGLPLIGFSVFFATLTYLFLLPYKPKIVKNPNIARV